MESREAKQRRRVRTSVRSVRETEEGGQPIPLYLSWFLLLVILTAFYYLADGGASKRTIAIEIVYLRDRETVTDVAHLFCDLGIMGENARVCDDQVVWIDSFIPPRG